MFVTNTRLASSNGGTARPGPRSPRPRVDHDGRAIGQPEAGEPANRGIEARTRLDVRTARAGAAEWAAAANRGRRHKEARTKFQESFKYEEVTPRPRRVRETSALEPNELEDLNLADWLGGRDSNSEQGLFLTW